MMCDEEEDCEVVLKNSELYKYLLNCNSQEFDYYDKSFFEKREEQQKTSLRTSITKVPTEFLSHLNVILNSNILLDEDVSYLYGYTVDLISDLKVKKNWDVVVTSLFSVCSLVVAVKYNSLIKSETILESFQTLNCYFNKWRRTQCLLNLITTAKHLHLYFKKTLQILHEQNAYFKLQELKFKTNGKSDEFDLLEVKRRTEVDTLSAVLSQCIINNILSTRDAIRCLISKLPLIHPIDSADHYLAYLSDDKLGLFAFTSASVDTSSSTNLDTLKNIYLLMQSEFFRRLGLCFCPTLWSADVPINFLSVTFEVVEKYNKSCEGVLSVIKFYYTKHVFPDVLESHRPRDSNLLDGYLAVHKISTSLSQLVMDSKLLEEHIDSLKCFDDLEASNMCNRLEELRNDLDKSRENVICAEKYFSKLRRVKDAKLESGDSEEVHNDKTFRDKHPPKALEVSKTSHDIDSKDRVYFAITEGKMNHENISEEGDPEPVRYPNFLLTELKEALIDKKNEFHQRENKAVENPEEYQKFLETKIEEPDDNSKHRELPEIRSCDLQMSKMLAFAVAQRSIHFFNQQQEEQFGSSDESDIDDQS